MRALDGLAPFFVAFLALAVHPACSSDGDDDSGKTGGGGSAGSAGSSNGGSSGSSSGGGGNDCDPACTGDEVCTVCRGAMGEDVFACIPPNISCR